MSHGHWIVNRVILGHEMSFNMDTLVAMWAAMFLLLAVSFVATRKMSIFPTKLQLLFEKILGYFSGLFVFFLIEPLVVNFVYLSNCDLFLDFIH